MNLVSYGPGKHLRMLEAKKVAARPMKTNRTPGAADGRGLLSGLDTAVERERDRL